MFQRKSLIPLYRPHSNIFVDFHECNHYMKHLAVGSLLPFHRAFYLCRNHCPVVEVSADSNNVRGPAVGENTAVAF